MTEALATEIPLAPLPSYEDVEGTQPLLGFQDFWPRCLNNEGKAKHATFEDFRDVIRDANNHLSCHPDLAVFSIETIEKKVYETKSIYQTLTIFKPGYICYGDKYAFWIKGLRLWFTQNLASEAQQISYQDVAPRGTVTANEEYPHFGNLKDLVNTFNNEIEHNGTNGCILSIQTVHINISKDAWESKSHCGRLNATKTEQCVWPDEFKHHRMYFLRVFFEQGADCRKDKIGIQDFAPTLPEEGGAFEIKTKLSDFSEVVQKAAMWLKNFVGLRVTNMQTVESMYGHSGNDEKATTLTCMDYNMHQHDRVRTTFLRLAYVQPDTYTVPKVPSLSYHALYPLYNNNNETGHWETTEQSEHRIKVWLEKTGAKVICAETLYQPAAVYSKEGKTSNHTVYHGDWYMHKSNQLRNKMLQHFRLYIDGPLSQDESPAESGYYDEERGVCCTLI